MVSAMHRSSGFQGMMLGGVILLWEASVRICASSPAHPRTGSIANQRPLSRVREPPSLDHAAQIGIDGAAAWEARGLTTDNPFDWAVHAYKSRHRLDVYFKGHL